MLLDVPWQEILIPTQPLEIIVRGTLAYLGLLVLFRVVLHRQAGNFASSDMLMMVLVADAIQNGMAGDYKSTSDGLLLVATILVWNFLVDAMSYRIRWLNRLLVSPPVPLVVNGTFKLRNMRREYVTQHELWEQLRLNGVQDLNQVRLACLENNGEISVIKDGV